ncbi:MAG: protein-glutamate O-methyltransferase CheR [Candidatus Kapaibacterium sp.]
MDRQNIVHHTGGDELERLEIQLLLEAIYRRYGFDFREYAYSSLRRRVWKAVHSENLLSVSALQEKVLHEPACWRRVLPGLSVNVTSMFRDPGFYRALRRIVVPYLRECPFVRIWHVGCATGEEVYSLAIMLEEEGVLDRCRIYATDINEIVLQKARSGIYPLRVMQAYTGNYQLADGKRSFSEYYTARYGHAMMRQSLNRNIIFSRHNLVSDGAFNEFHLILCRNVLIYFNKALQDRVHQMIFSGLAASCFLGLGEKETIRYTPHENDYAAVAPGERLYQRIESQV